MKALADKSVGVTICDPPFGEYTHSKIRRGGSFHAPDVTTGGPKRPVISTSVVLGFGHITEDVRAAAAAEFARVTARWVLVFCEMECLHLWRECLERAGLEYVRGCLWDKEGGTPQFTGDRPGIPGETIVVAHQPGRKRWNAGGRRGIYRFPVCSGPERVHPTQKPDDLILALVSDFTDPGELVCDPFAGSGTTAVACKRLGREFIGWEKDPRFHAAAVKRIDAAREQFQLPRTPKPRQQKLVLP